MNDQNELIISKTDFEKISAIVSLASTEQAELLEDELARATIVSDDQLPDDVVSMNSKVVFEDLDDGKTSAVTLVYPADASVEENKVSVIAPVGAALIGLSVGQTITWPVSEKRTRRIKVIAVQSLLKKSHTP